MMIYNQTTIAAVLIDDKATLKRFSKTNDSIILQAENLSMTDWPSASTLLI